MEKLQLTIDKQQAQALCQALETYTRLHLGQIDAVMENFRELTWKERRAIHSFTRRYIFKEHPENGGPGIAHDDTEVKAKLAYEIMSVVKHAWSNGRDPFPVSGVPLPTVRLLTEGEI
jgi:hypothetical protein